MLIFFYLIFVPYPAPSLNILPFWINFLKRSDISFFSFFAFVFVNLLRELALEDSLIMLINNETDIVPNSCKNFVQLYTSHRISSTSFTISEICVEVLMILCVWPLRAKNPYKMLVYKFWSIVSPKDFSHSTSVITF